MSVDMTPADNLNDAIVYVLLNKVKENGEERKDVQFHAEDFDGQQVSREELVGQINHLIQSGYLLAEIEPTQSSESSSLIVCKDAEITTDGRAILKAKYYRVDHS